MSAPTAPIINQDTPFLTNTSIQYYWRPPTSSGSSPISTYTLLCPSISYSNSVQDYRREIVLNNLSSGIAYTTQIFATNSDGYSGPIATYQPLTPGFAPTSASQQQFRFENNAIRIFWSPPTYTGNSPITQYALWIYSTNPNGSINSNEYSQKYYYRNTQLSTLFYYPSYSSNYKFLVRAINNVGWSPDTASEYTYIPMVNIPSTIGRLSLWIDSTDTSTWTTFNIGQNVYISTIADKSGRSTLQFTSTFSNDTLPFISTGFNIAGMPSFTFTSTSGIVAKSTISSIKHLFIVGRMNATTTTNTIIGHTDYSDWCGSTNTFISPFDASPDVYNAPSKIYVCGDNGLQATFSSLSNITTRSFLLNVSPLSDSLRINTLGCGLPTSLGSYSGTIGEVLMYDSTLSSGEIDSVNRYLISKWFAKYNKNFSPSSVANCFFWTDMSYPQGYSTYSTSVVQMNDLSPTRYHMCNAPTSNFYPLLGTPLNGKRTASFLSNSGIRQAYSTLNNVASLFWVGRQGPQVDLPFLFGSRPSSNFSFHASSNPLRFIDNTANSSTGIRSSLGTLYTLSSFSYFQSFAMNIILPPVSTPFLFSITNIPGNVSTLFDGLCYDREIPARGWCGDLGEVICYRSTMSIQDQEKVEYYLRNKWNI
jgi:hypothetical protein